MEEIFLLAFALKYMRFLVDLCFKMVYYLSTLKTMTIMYLVIQNNWCSLEIKRLGRITEHKDKLTW